MAARATATQEPDPRYVSTYLPSGPVTALVAEAHARYTSIAKGRNSQVYPALAAVPPGCSGCVVGTAARLRSGDTDSPSR